VEVLDGITSFDLEFASLADRAIVLYRILMAEEPGRYEWSLASILYKYVRTLRSISRYDEAAKRIEEAVTIYRLNKDVSPLWKTEFVHASLEMAITLIQLEKYDRGLQVIDEALDVVDAQSQDPYVSALKKQRKIVINHRSYNANSERRRGQ
jgi:tetratricopeptide (TPR) repeat protein